MAIEVPRDFVLLEELNIGERIASSDGHFSWGIEGDDMTLSEWNASILGPEGTCFAGRFYQLHMTCGPTYPKQPPKIRFLNRVNLPGVDASGNVVMPQFTPASWAESPRSFEYALNTIFVAMQINAGLSQPPEDSKY